MYTKENRVNKPKWARTKVPKPWQVKSEAYKVFINEYGYYKEKIQRTLKKHWINLNSIEAVMKATRILDAMKRVDG
jgi:hypothetical protein